MADPVERIRSKVVAGERLSDEELAQLERAAARQRTPSLRLAVAHALMNAEEDRRALELLRGLLAERPADPNVRLALARGLLGVERYADAEAELKEALALRPGDPEALKALAALSMRHGELSRARALVAEAVLRDPFDGEARVLKEELESAAAGPALLSSHALASPDEFRRALRDALKQRQLPHLARGKDLLVRLPEGEVARVALRSLYDEYVQRRVSLAEGVRAAVAQLQQLRSGLPHTREELLARVLPVLRPAGFSESATAAVYREGPAGLLLYYVLEDPELVRYVPPASLQTLGVTLDQLDAAARENLGRNLAEPMALTVDAEGNLRPSQTPGPLCALATGDGHDGARLLLAEQRVRVAKHLGPGPWRVHLGRRELAVIAREAEPLAGLPVAEDGVAGLFELTLDGQLSPVTP